jgi:hypothetical protein
VNGIETNVNISEHQIVRNLSKTAKVNILNKKGGGVSKLRRSIFVANPLSEPFVGHLCRSTERNRTQPNDFGSPFPRFSPVQDPNPNATERIRTIFSRSHWTYSYDFTQIVQFASARKSNKTERFHDRSIFDHAVPTTYDDAFTSRSVFLVRVSTADPNGTERNRTISGLRFLGLLLFKIPTERNRTQPNDFALMKSDRK